MSRILLSAIGGFLLAWLLAQLCKPLARRTGVVARPKSDRWHREVVPLLGGVAIALAIGLTTLVLPVYDRQLLSLLAGAGALFAIGLWDDIRPLKPQTKFVLQVLVAAVLTSLGLQLHLTRIAPVDVLLSLFWLVAITNAFNLLDNMDGLSAGIAAITAGFRLITLLHDGDMEAAQVAAAVVGACLGFLLHNFNPASIFMGDAGSMFLGFLVAGLSLVGTFPYSRSTLSVLLFPVLILFVPIFDTTFVTIARSLAGRPISRGGRDHTSHRLVASGLTERGAVLVLYFVALLCGGVAFHGYMAGLSASIVFVVVVSLGLVFFGLYLGRIQVYSEEELRKLPEGAVVRLFDRVPYKRQMASVVIDSLLVVVAYYAAYLLRFEQTFQQNEAMFTLSVPTVLACQLLAFAGCRVYQGVWRYTSVPDLVRILKAASLGTGASVLVLLLFFRFQGYSRAVFVIYWLLLILLVSGSRLSLRMFGELLRRDRSGQTRVLIYGAGDGGVLALREMRDNRDSGRLPLGFIDDNRWKQRTSIHGIPVVGGYQQLDELIDKYLIDEIVISSSKIPADRIESLMADCEARGVRVVRAWVAFDRVIAS